MLHVKWIGQYIIQLVFLTTKAIFLEEGNVSDETLFRLVDFKSHFKN